MSSISSLDKSQFRRVLDLVALHVPAKHCGSILAQLQKKSSRYYVWLLGNIATIISKCAWYQVCFGIAIA